MNEPEYIEMSLRQLRLRAGIALQTRCNSQGTAKEEAQFLAAIEGKGVMVSHAGRTRLTVGSEYQVSGFSGQYDFHFASPLIHVFDAPFAYALLAYPETIKARMVRRAVRMKVSLPATVRVPGNADPLPVTMLDLSVYGTMFHTRIAVPGNNIELEIKFPCERKMEQVVLAATVRHSQRAESGGQHVGVAFQDVSKKDMLLLHYLIHSTTNEDPS